MDLTYSPSLAALSPFVVLRCLLTRRAMSTFRDGCLEPTRLKFWAPGQLIFLRPLKAKGGITSSDVPGGGDVERGSSVDGIGRSESPRAGVAKTASSVESSRRVYHATWVTFDQVEAEGLLLSSHAPDDHNLVNVCAAIRDCYCSSSSASTSRLPN